MRRAVLSETAALARARHAAALSAVARRGGAVSSSSSSSSSRLVAAAAGERSAAAAAAASVSRGVVAQRGFSSEGAAAPQKVPIALVKQLRAATLAGYADCQKALRECDLDVAKATAWLRAKGAASAAKRASRTAAEGTVAAHVSADGSKAVLVELNAETDFVARGPRFLSLADCAARAAVTAPPASVDAVLDVTVANDPAPLLETDPSAVAVEQSVKAHIEGVAAAVGENLRLRRTDVIERAKDTSAVGAYVHNVKGSWDSGVSAGGRAAIVSVGLVDGVAGGELLTPNALSELARELAKQVVGFGAEFAHVEDVTEAALEAHRADFEKAREEAMQARSAAEEAQSKVMWSPKRAHADFVLWEQDHMGSGKKVRDFVFGWCKKQGWAPPADAPRGPPVLPVRVEGFVRYVCGEGITREEPTESYADEVARLAKGE